MNVYGPRQDYHGAYIAVIMKMLDAIDKGESPTIMGDGSEAFDFVAVEDCGLANLCAMKAEAVDSFLETGDARALRQARKRFMKDHGTVFWVLGVMQWFWYGSDRRRERFVKICEDKDVQQLTFDSYMNKQLTRQRPMAHVRIFFKDVAHLLGLARV